MRLLPRFSLRFAWIALTIFLIVFAVVVNYYQRYQAHERIATQLMNVGCAVEEEQLNLFGFEIGKRLRGIQVGAQDGLSYLSLLEQLPRPLELKRFGNQQLSINQQAISQMLDELEKFTELEELYLHYVTFTHEQVQLLGRLPKLRVLDLTRCDLPRGSLALLANMPQLETLILDTATYDASELLKLQLPRLRLIDVSGSALEELALTKAGWGRFPKLESFSLRENRLRRIVAEPGALLELIHLDLGAEGFECQIDGQALSSAAPELTLLAFPMPWLEPQVIPQLASLAKLRYFYFDEAKTPGLETLAKTSNPNEGAEGGVDPSLSVVLAGAQTVRAPTYGPSGIQPFAPLALADGSTNVSEPWLTLLRAWHKRRPDVLFSADHDATRMMVTPSGYNPFGPNLWLTPNWRAAPSTGTTPNGGGAGLF